MATKEPTDLTTRVLVEIRDELKGHRAQFVEIRDQLVEARAQRAEHGAALASLGVTVKQILRAVEHGNAQRDERVADHEMRISRLEARAGLQP